MVVLMRIALSILLVAGIAKAQIPEPCASATSFLRRECCPTPTNVGSNPGPCGMNLTRPRGECVGIPNGVVNDSDPRQNWPLFYFTRVCNCASNYGGYDCGECAFGYRGPNCSQRYTRQRRSTSELTDREWNTYINQLQMAKSNSTSRYRVITSPPDYNNLAALQTEPIGVYNLFVWFHHYVAKDNENGGIDYAHEATGFPTWHRLFLLWFEREMQYTTGDENFTVHYWDWRNPDQRESLFTSDRLGEHAHSNNRIAAGHMFSEWQTVCWYGGSINAENTEPSGICNPNVFTGPLQRCPDARTCAADYEGWPSFADVQTAVGMQDYDHANYNKYSPRGFRGFMEGFQVLDRGCDTNTARGRDLCRVERVEGVDKGIQRLLHNTVHVILGLGHFPVTSFPSNQRGVMGDVAASANDPIFINHHAMIDCILEKWLQDNNGVVYPINDSIRPGHRRDDYIVPFIPLYTHNMMFKPADSLGYTCNLPNQPPTTPMTTATRATTTQAPPPPSSNEPDSAKAATALLYMLVLAIVGTATIILYL